MSIEQITNKQETPTILLYGTIGGDEPNSISGKIIADQIYSYQDQGFKKINVRIISPGGSVLDGYMIFKALTECKMKITTYNDYMCASIAGLILLAGDKIKCASDSLFMLHNPSMPISDPKDLEILNLIKASLINSFQNRTPMSADLIDNLMNKETWMDSGEMKKMGICDDVFSSKKEIKNNKELQPLYNICNTIIINKNKNKMLENISKILNLKNNATEDEIKSEVEKIQNSETELKTKNDELTQKVSDLETELEKFKDEKKVILEKEITDVINKAAIDGKIKDESKATWKKLANLDFEEVKNSLASIITNSKTSVKISEVINKNVSKTDDARKDWTIRDYEKKAPKDLLKIKNETPEIYQEMYDAFYKKK